MATTSTGATLAPDNNNNNNNNNTSQATPTFPPVYYNSPLTQMVFGADITAADNLTASITLGSPYFSISALDVCNWVSSPVSPTNPVANIPTALANVGVSHPGQNLSAPVATSDGTKPLAVKPGQYVRLWVTLDVPKGSSLPLGKVSGSASIVGKSINLSATFNGTYLGTLMGKTVVEPPSVVPGQPVLVQVCDAAGNPISDPSVTVSIQGEPISKRYFQFPTVGNRTFFVTANRGSLSESTQVAIAVEGTPLLFRTTLALPGLSEMPILQVHSATDPYTANFSLGDTQGIKRRLTPKFDPTPPQTGIPKTIVPDITPKVVLDPMAAEIAGMLKNAPTDEVSQLSPKLIIPEATGVQDAVGSLSIVRGLIPTTPAIATSYQWDFGDGQIATTQSPYVSHSYFKAIQAQKVTHSFDVSCRVVHDNITVKQTLVLKSPYGVCRQLRLIVPPVTAPAYATFQQIAFFATMVIHNLEAEEIRLTSMAIVPFSDVTAAAPRTPAFVSMKRPIIVAAQSSTAIGCYVTPSQLKLNGHNANSFAVKFMGTVTGLGANSWPVRFSYCFRILLADSGATTIILNPKFGPPNWDIGGALASISSLTASVSKVGSSTSDSATNTIAIPLSVDARDPNTLGQIQSIVQAGLTSIALKTGALDPIHPTLVAPIAPSTASKIRPLITTEDDPVTPWNPPPVAINAECYPGDISDANQATAAADQLVCQLSTIASDTSTTTIPSAFQNAQAGDVILSPAPVGDGDLIAQMFGALSPPQVHGHSGVMTADQYQITHCTASVARIRNNLNTVLKIPTSLKPDMLEYGWPGSITQSVDDATTPVTWIDPSGTQYKGNVAFNTDPRGFKLAWPMVVKPLYENEEFARPALRKMAVTALSKGASYGSDGKLLQKGGCYYSFYAYTIPQMSAGFTDAAGAEAGWAQGLVPAVCSSFAWLCCKENGLPLVTTNIYEKLSDFSASAIGNGALVGPDTLDGLVFYPEADRLQGAQALRSMFMAQAEDQEYGLGSIPGINEAVAGPIADQLLNSFAFGTYDAVGSSAWQSPGNANAVSPDNIMMWNPPYYGLAEPLQFLPSHTEVYTISRWKQVIAWGSIKGVVRYNGKPVPNTKVWVSGPSVFTGADGSYTLPHVAIGEYMIQALAVMPVGSLSVTRNNGLGGQLVTLTAADPNITMDLNLQDDPISFRQLVITYSLNCDHGDDSVWPFRNPSGVESVGPYNRTLLVNPGNPTNNMGWGFNYAGGGLFSVNYTLSISLVVDLSVEVVLTANMEDPSNAVQQQWSVDPIYVAVGQKVTGSWNGLEHTGTGYHNGPANFSFSLQNEQQTG